MAQESLNFLRVLRGAKRVGLSQRMLQDLQSGAYALPISESVGSRYPGEQRDLKHAAPRSFRPPENKLMGEIYRKYPYLRFEPVTANAFQPPLAKVFALRYHDLMKGALKQRGPSAHIPPYEFQRIRDHAFKQAEAELTPRIQEMFRKQVGHTQSSQVAYMQAREGEALEAAISHVKPIGK